MQCLAVYMLLMQSISRNRELLVRGVVLLLYSVLLHSHPCFDHTRVRVCHPAM